MDLKTFLSATLNTYQSKHGDDFIYIGHDPAKQWTAFFKGNEQELGVVDTVEQAKVAAHRLFDSGKNCSIKLDWKLIPESEVKDVAK